MIPLYGFLQGDTMGLLILADPDETVGALAEKLKDAAAVRVARKERVRVMVRGRWVDPDDKVSSVPLAPLDRFDVLDEGG